MFAPDFQPVARLYYMVNDLGDQWMCVGWYCRKLILQEIERGGTQQGIADRGGVTQPALVPVVKEGKGVGVPMLFALAKAFRLEPTELLAESIRWWEKSGRKERSDALDQLRKDADVVTHMPKRGRKPKTKAAR
jgi:hypothetical protein